MYFCKGIIDHVHDKQYIFMCKNRGKISQSSTEGGSTSGDAEEHNKIH